jgi:hypothetical protein
MSREGREKLNEESLGLCQHLWHKRMNRFTPRSKLKVDVQWTRTRFALVHNIGRIHTFGAPI